MIGDALERFVAFERVKAAALVPEAWILAAAVGYLLVRVVPWALAGFPVVGR